MRLRTVLVSGRDRGGVAVATGFASYRCRTTVAIDARTLSLPLAFAAGAVLAALADTLMPEAYERGGPTRRAEYRGGLPAIFRPFGAVRPTVRRHMGARGGDSTCRPCPSLLVSMFMQ